MQMQNQKLALSSQSLWPQHLQPVFSSCIDECLRSGHLSFPKVRFNNYFFSYVLSFFFFLCFTTAPSSAGFSRKLFLGPVPPSAAQSRSLATAGGWAATSRWGPWCASSAALATRCRAPAASSASPCPARWHSGTFLCPPVWVGDTWQYSSAK